jgi:hypothetical protein
MIKSELFRNNFIIFLVILFLLNISTEHPEPEHNVATKIPENFVEDVSNQRQIIFDNEISSDISTSKTRSASRWFEYNMMEPIWMRTFGDFLDYGNQSEDYGFDLLQTPDGGYIIIGETNSFGSGSSDAWLIKTNETGIEQWNRTFGGIFPDVGNSIDITSDGGYIIGGTTNSYGTLFIYGPGYNYQSIWVIKTDVNGTEQWNRTFSSRFNPKCYSIKQTADNGFIILGSNNIHSWWDLEDIWLIKIDKYGEEQWNYTYGTEYDDNGFSLQITDDGGYIIVGKTGSFIAYSGNNEYNRNSNLWLLKVNSTGHEEWNRTFGGARNEVGRSVQQTTDGGYIIAGTTESIGSGSSDGWVIKTNSSGYEEWNKTIGGLNNDQFFSIKQTSGGEYIIVGQTESYGDYMYLPYVWLCKISSTGSEKWNKSIGKGWGLDTGYSVIETSEGDFVFTGMISSFSDYNYDAFLIKTNSDGGGGERNKPPRCSMISYSTYDSGMIRITGISTDPDGQLQQMEVSLDNSNWIEILGGPSWTYELNASNLTEGNHTISFRVYDGELYSKNITFNFYIHSNEEKAEAEPEILWWKTYGGRYDDYIYSIEPTSDGGYIIAGASGAYYLTYAMWQYQIMLIKLDSQGIEQWRKTYGDGKWSYSSDRKCYAVQTSDGGYVITGEKWNNGNGGDLLLIKTDSSGTEEWNRVFGGSGQDHGRVVREAADGGFFILGETASYGSGNYDLWLLKTDSEGTKQWNKTFGGPHHDYGYSLELTPTGGCLITGIKTVTGYENRVWLIETDSSGSEILNETYPRGPYSAGCNAKKTSDGGIIIAGKADFDNLGMHLWLIKTDESGAIQWENTFEKSSYFTTYGVEETSDSGYIISGARDLRKNEWYDDDIYVLKTDESGIEQWNITLDWINADYGCNVLETEKGTYIVAGYTYSQGSGDFDIVVMEIEPPNITSSDEDPSDDHEIKEDDDKGKSKFQQYLIVISTLIFILLILITIMLLKGRKKAAPKQEEDPRERI